MCEHECLTQYFPTAERVLFAGHCPSCKELSLVSFTLSDLSFGDTENRQREYCGYFCEYCSWSNAGERWKGGYLKPG